LFLVQHLQAELENTPIVVHYRMIADAPEQIEAMKQMGRPG
jgi:hypothetical protein